MSNVDSKDILIFKDFKILLSKYLLLLQLNIIAFGKKTIK